MKTRDPARIPGPEGLERLVEATRQILAVPKSAIADKMKEPIYGKRKARRRGRRVPK